MKNGVVINGVQYEPKVRSQRKPFSNRCDGCDILNLEIAFCKGLCDFFGHGDCNFKKVEPQER